MKYSLPFMTTVLITFATLTTGCGGGAGSSDTTAVQPTTEDLTVEVTATIDKTSKSYFGTLSDATVNIYALGDGPKQLLYTESTSSGSTTAEVGNFNPHIESLESNKFYLYEVVGGHNLDTDNDGIIDETPTENKIIYRSINRGTKAHVNWWSVNTQEQNSTVEAYSAES